MMKKKITAKTAAFALAAMLVAPAMADPAAEWANNCGPAQQARQRSNASTVDQVANEDPYLEEMAKKNVSGPNASQQSAGTDPGGFSCNSLVKDAFSGMFDMAGSFFGIDLSTLLGGIANAKAGDLCGDVSKSIGKTFGGMGLSCPRVNAPGFNSNCSVRMGANSNGVTLNGNGALGGYNGGFNGTMNGGGASGASRVNNGSGNQTVVTGGSGGSGSSGGGQGVAGSVACWFTGNC